tara:strand:+ start:5220 stop:5510 length:291 start_codon:yes stop_codon:yes gene_type:complete
MWVSKCCGALPLTEIYEGMGKCRDCKDDTEFYNEDMPSEVWCQEYEDRKKMKKYKYVNEEARKAWKKIDKQIHDNPLGEGFAHKDKKDKHNKKHSK